MRPAFADSSTAQTCPRVHVSMTNGVVFPFPQKLVQKWLSEMQGALGEAHSLVETGKNAVAQSA